MFSVVELEWSAPLMSNGIIRGYQIAYFPTGNNETRSIFNASSSVLEFNITGLTAFTTYLVSVSAITIAIGNAGSVIVRTEEDSKFSY